MIEARPSNGRIALKRVAHVMPSNVDKHSVEGEQPVALCNYVDVYKYDRITGGIEFMRATATAAQVERFTLRANDVIVTKDSEEPTDIGVPAFVPTDMPGVVCGYHLALLRPNATRLHGGFLAWWLRASEAHAYFSTAATGISRYGLSVNDIGMTPLRCPSIESQQRIANFLDEQTARIDALIAEKGRLMAAVEEYGHAEVSRLLATGTRRTEFEPTTSTFVPKAPRGWRVTALKRALLGMEQGWSPQCDSRPAQDGEWGVLKVGCVNGLRFEPRENKALPENLAPDLSCVIKAGDVLVSRANTRELVGMAALVEEDHPNLLLCDKLYRLRLRSDWVTPAFTVLALRAEASRRQIELEASGASASMQNISQDVLRELTVAIPPLAEQTEIVTRATQVRAATQELMGHVVSHLERLREYRSSIISAAVTGQLDISTFRAKQLEAA